MEQVRGDNECGGVAHYWEAIQGPKILDTVQNVAYKALDWITKQLDAWGITRSHLKVMGWIALAISPLYLTATFAANMSLQVAAIGIMVSSASTSLLMRHLGIRFP